MSNIPDDIMKAAREHAHSIGIVDIGSTEGIRVIARAILAERERCARIAKTYGWPCRFEPKQSEYIKGCRDTGDYIAADIRKGRRMT